MNKLGKKVFPYAMLLPTLLVFGIFIIYPAVSGFITSFYKWDGVDDAVFIGIKNYGDIFADKSFWTSVLRTIFYTGVSVFLLYYTSLGLALLLTKPLKGTGFFRSSFYWPTMISSVIVGLSWQFILGKDFGIINYVLSFFGKGPVSFLTDSKMAMFSVIFVTVWLYAGYYMVMFIAGINSISGTYYEAAMIDGATPFQMLRFITMPLLRPTSVLVLTLSITAIVKGFPLVNSLTKGGPGSATKFMVQNIYETAFEKSKMGYASAMSTVLFVILSLVTLIQFKLNKGGEQDAN